MLIVSALLLLVFNNRFRSLEAIVAGPLIGLGTGSKVEVEPSVALIFFDVHTWRMEGLRITAECTAAVVIAPFLLMAGGIITFGKFRISRVLAGVAVAAAILFGVNQLRLVVIAFATHEWGLLRGYGWSHLLVGSLITSFGAIVAIAVFFVIVSRPGRRGRIEPAVEGGSA
ncbi:exosortase/archaeosortase family protein [Kitasatospora azatica]|uniref:exosortase/archaeosortase family protein n=1 Tax=Kitasatospora azatica TaxID=58347 RepID=UPI00056601D4|nr:exosortase/archaeosortase family protein [Kitasatospora azatica]